MPGFYRGWWCLKPSGRPWGLGAVCLGSGWWGGWGAESDTSWLSAGPAVNLCPVLRGGLQVSVQTAYSDGTNSGGLELPGSYRGGWPRFLGTNLQMEPAPECSRIPYVGGVESWQHLWVPVPCIRPPRDGSLVPRQPNLAAVEGGPPQAPAHFLNPCPFLCPVAFPAGPGIPGPPTLYGWPAALGPCSTPPPLYSPGPH